MNENIKISGKDSYLKQTNPDTSEYECFFHYTDELLYQAGFEQGCKDFKNLESVCIKILFLHQLNQMQGVVFNLEQNLKFIIKEYYEK